MDDPIAPHEVAAKIVADHCPDFSEAAAKSLREAIEEAMNNWARIYATED